MRSDYFGIIIDYALTHGLRLIIWIWSIVLVFNVKKHMFRI